MSHRPSGIEPPDIPSVLADVPENEFESHQEFVHRHIDFLIDVLTAEQYHRHWSQPDACPHATPVVQSRRRRPEDQFPCRYQSLPTDGESDQSACDCGDPLVGSDDPLDTVASVAIAPQDRTPAERYYDTEYREIIAQLRENIGSWDDIAALDEDQLSDELSEVTNRPGISDHRADRLNRLLSDIADYSNTEGVTLPNIKGFSYSRFCDLLSDFPGISRSDGWWLFLTAFDKPVWPADPHIDALLYNLGLLTHEQVQNGDERREELEDALTQRQIPALHRAVAGHAFKGSVDVCTDDCEIRKFLLSYRMRKQSEDRGGPVIIDLFSGAGGLSLGFSETGWTIELAIDNDREATDTYRLNHPEVPHEKVICKDIRDAIEEGVLDEIDYQPDVIVGGPPCQSLSQAGYRARLADVEDYSILDDDRTALYNQYVEAIDDLRPKALVMENVEGMMNEVKDTGIKVGDLVIDSIESIGGTGSGYVCDYKLLNALDYGIPQDRERVIILGIRDDLTNPGNGDEISELFDRLAESGLTKELSLKHGLSGLPKIKRGEGGNVVPTRVRGSRSTYVDSNNLEQGTNLSFNHQAREHPMEKDRVLFDEALDPGDTGWDVKYAKDGEYSHLIEYDVGTEENPRFQDKYRKLRWGDPSPTVVAHLAKDANNFILPDYYQHVATDTRESDDRRNRGITPREAARLQSFPDEFIFLGPFTSWFEQIGNAVPPLLGKRISRVLEDYIDTNPITMSHTEISQPPFDQVSTDD